MGVNKAGLLVIANSNNKQAVIFVHGLHGDPVKTWRQSDKYKTLPELIALDNEILDIDVYSFGYRSKFVRNQYDFREISKILFSEIKAHVAKKDIIFITHSMGGLIVQQYLIDQSESFNTDSVKQVKGVIYLAVPFEGSKSAGFASMFLPFHKQINTLIERNPSLIQLKENWVKYFFRGGHEALPDEMRVTFEQIALYGARDMVVSKNSASPFHIGATVIAVDASHTDICKVNELTTEYKHIKDFIIDIITLEKKINPMVVHVHGWEKQNFQEEAHYPLDWTKHFQITASSRTLPSQEIWLNEIIPHIDFISREWSEKWINQGGIVRIYAKLCLTGGLLLGSRLSYTKGVKLEVDHYGQLWAADNHDSSYTTRSKNTPGNCAECSRAIVIISVSKDIQNEVEQYLSTTQIEYNKIVNILPSIGPGQKSIENAKQALSYAISVKNEIEQLKNEGIREIYLFLNAPLSVTFFIGHRLTATCPIMTFEYNGTGYVSSCHL